MQARGALLATARSLRQSSYTKVPADRPTLLAGRQVPARAQFANSNEREYSQEEPRYAHGNNYLPAAALAIGLGLTAQHAMEEQEDSFSIDKLDINDVNAVITIFKNGTEDEKRELAQRIGQNITHYKIEDIISFLLQTEKRPHRLIVNALAKNIKRYTPKQISEILTGDTQDETHDLIASALAKNYNSYTGYTFGGYRLYSTQDGIYQYAQAISSLKEENQSKAIRPLADDLDKNNIHDGLGWNIEKIIKNAPEQSKQVIISAIIQNMNNNKEETLIAMNRYIGIDNVLEHCNEHNAEMITAFIVKNFNEYSINQIFSILNVSTDKNKKSIIAAVAQNINSSTGKHLDIFNNFKRNYVWGLEVLFEILKACNEQTQATVTAIIIDNIEKYSGETLFDIIKLATAKNREIILCAIAKKVDEFIDQHAIDSQSAAHLKENTMLAWEYITTIANNPKYKAAFQQALSHERSISNDSAVFYHSQKSPVYWLELLYTKFWEQKYNQKSTNYLFTRFPDDVGEFSNAVLQLDGQKKKSILLKEGRINELRPYLFFVNYALFGNSARPGSCSTYYFIENFNVGDPEITSQTIIDKFGDQAIFDKYKIELEQLEKEFKEIVPNSVLLQLAIPHKTLNDHVYLAVPGGVKKKLQISGEETDDVATIIKTLKTTPKVIDDTDRQEFCVVMTPDTVHTLREEGAEVRVYGGFNQGKLNALILKLEMLIARIAQENPQTFSAKLTPPQCYQAYKPVLNELMQKKD